MHYVLKEEEMSEKANKVKRISFLAFQQKILLPVLHYTDQLLYAQNNAECQLRYFFSPFIVYTLEFFVPVFL